MYVYLFVYRVNYSEKARTDEQIFFNQIRFPYDLAFLIDSPHRIAHYYYSIQFNP